MELEDRQKVEDQRQRKEGKLDNGHVHIHIL